MTGRGLFDGLIIGVSNLVLTNRPTAADVSSGYQALACGAASALLVLLFWCAERLDANGRPTEKSK